MEPFISLTKKSATVLFIVNGRSFLDYYYLLLPTVNYKKQNTYDQSSIRTWRICLHHLLTIHFLASSIRKRKGVKAKRNPHSFNPIGARPNILRKNGV